MKIASIKRWKGGRWITSKRKIEEKEEGEFCILGSFQFRKLLFSRYTPRPIGNCLPNEIHFDEGKNKAVLDGRSTVYGRISGSTEIHFDEGKNKAVLDGRSTEYGRTRWDGSPGGARPPYGVKNWYLPIYQFWRKNDIQWSVWTQTSEIIKFYVDTILVWQKYWRSDMLHSISLFLVFCFVIYEIYSICRIRRRIVRRYCYIMCLVYLCDQDALHEPCSPATHIYTVI